MCEGAVDFQARDGSAARVAYRRAGRGPAVVLIHGVGLQKAIWEPQMEVLVADHDVMSIDMPGHGASTRPPEGPRLADYADAVVRLDQQVGEGATGVAGEAERYPSGHDTDSSGVLDRVGAAAARRRMVV